MSRLSLSCSTPRRPPYRAGSDFLRVAETAAPLLGMEVKAAHVHDVAEIEPVIAAVAREGNGGLISLPDIFVSTALQPRAVCAGDDCLGDNCVG